ncbi:MAG: CHC2 zinc finger domain-containing protein [Verrucomicrobiota bacterium]
MSGKGYDIPRIKDKLPALSEMLSRDGHELRKQGSAIFTCCPFHEENTPSCQVDDRTGKFHCFGCGAGGDIFDYWQKATGLSFHDTLEQLAGMAGIGPETEYTPRRAAPVVKPKVEEKPPEPLEADALERWKTACERLANDGREIERIAAWRGIEPGCIRWAARRGLMGTYVWWDSPREAFLVEMPTALSPVPVAVHIRLAAGTKGNPTDRKASWNFNPKGCGAWPFIIGDLTSADYIFLCEGQWDALALVSLMGWHERETWPKVAVVGLRGSSSGALLLKHEINPTATLFAIADADGAGARWFVNKGDMVEVKGKEVEVREDGLLTKLHDRCRTVAAFWPTTRKADLNDLVKSGEITRPLLLGYLQPLMVNPKTAKRGPTFAQWCKAKCGDEEHGQAATYIHQDKLKPKGRRPLKDWERHWERTGVPEPKHADLVLAWLRYREDCK